MKRIREFRLRSRQWTTIAANFTGPEKLYLEVWSPHPVKWRRIGLLPGIGKFRKRGTIWSGFGIIQVKMFENRTLRVTHGGPPDRFYDDDKRTDPEVKAQYAMKNLPE